MKTNPNEPNQTQNEPNFSPLRGCQSKNEPKRTQFQTLPILANLDTHFSPNNQLRLPAPPFSPQNRAFLTAELDFSAKTAILIVEFSKQLREEGKSVLEAAATAAHLRFRPLLMTTVSFVLGVTPLVIASGAGAASRRSLGTAVFGGMLAATIIGVFLIPVLYVVIQSLSEKVRGVDKVSK